ncbi:uncharacterized protein F5891DRAFT_1277807 [Suillus fuscotomentosus]|uniref:Nephrocystin 3-like N-terminal domain-containing protein n=1 Tax=Suillus fuscotomentosus TaxID=1912939 RepID=A0AAD4E9Y8_9AGAM|nr:uncharacterized protein F5891DRAFT_1277807 [Suillus fuscotomentosus]KAG1901083.1 hypothetical protein F5891DRAFT_1277807 [Suillus fuscotomentosus]
MRNSAVPTVVADTSSEEKIFESLSAVVVHRALYDCPEWGPRHKLECLDGTCTKIMEEIETALQAENSTLIWLSGSPGTGKSAIAHTIASRLKNTSKLAGTFFFSRQHKDMPGMASLDFFAPTLAYQISKSKHLAKDAVIQSIRSDPIILDPRRSFTEQIQGLLVKPLQNLQVSWGHLEPKALVIDAIDACEEGRICELISCLSNLLHQPHIPHLHIVITSRPLHAIDDAFEVIGCEESIHHIALDDVDVTEDLRLLFKRALERSYRHHGLEYPGLESDDQTIPCLADRASGRFRAASMMIRFLETDDDDEVPCNLDEKIDLMKDPGDAYLDSTQIFRFYEFVINLSENPTRAYRHLSTVVNLAKPLAILHLRKLLGSSESDLSSVLASLSPIVSVPVDDSRPVEVLHIESLREFLSRHPSSSCASQLLAQSSLRTMRSSFLRQSGLKDKLQQMVTLTKIPIEAGPQFLMVFLKCCLAQPCSKTIYAATWYHEYAQGTGTPCCAPPSVQPCNMSEDISKARSALEDFQAKPEFRDLHVFELLSTLQTLPEMLIIVILLAIRHAHPASHVIDLIDGSDNEPIMPLALKHFVQYVRERSERIFSSSPALKHACRHWGWYLSQNSMAMNEGLRTYLRAFWRDKLLSWFERQWYLEGLESCITILNLAQTIDFKCE